MTVHSRPRGEGKRQDSKPSSPASVALLTTPPRCLSPRLHALLFQTRASQRSPNPIKRSPLRISIPEQSSHRATKITQRKPLIIYSPAHTMEKNFFLIAELWEKEKQNSKLLSFFFPDALSIWRANKMRKHNWAPRTRQSGMSSR